MPGLRPGGNWSDAVCDSSDGGYPITRRTNPNWPAARPWQAATKLSPRSIRNRGTPISRPPETAYDEVRAADGTLRPRWEAFHRAVPDPQGAEFGRRWREAKHLIRENGVTYNVYGDPNGLSRPWQLDPWPVILTQAEAEHLERGLVQRATLHEAILADLYGPRRLLLEGHLPPDLVFPNPGYLRPCHGVVPPQGRYLHLYAANLARSDDGTWHVLGDRTQAPSGAGYALENRIVVARILPEAFQACRVRRLATFFQTLIQTLRSIAPHNRENPRVVLLTPGPLNETYFEHSYLARYLGCTLAEGGDLTVRDNRVYLKVLGGLQPVDVVFRRLDDDFCDPLELRPDSFLGVPGLVHAVRSGHVAVANALGAGLLETPAMMAYLPALCRTLLGEELKLPSAPTWWCGDPEGFEYVSHHLRDLAIKPAFASARSETRFVAECDDPERAELVARLHANPAAFVGQERLALSSVPVLGGDGPSSRRMVLRAFLAADGHGFAMMPGGLTRVAGAPHSQAVSMQGGGGSKDTWVLSTGPVSTFSLLPPSDRPLVLTRAGGDLPSRAADNLYWLGRYAERAEGTSRLIRCALTRLLERPEGSALGDLALLLQTLRSAATLPPHRLTEPLPAPHGLPIDRELLELVFRSDRPGSLPSVVAEWHRVAATVRDRISADMWRVVSGALRSTREWPEGQSPTAGDALDVLDRTTLNLAAFGGLASESMTRSEGWRFLDLGRKLERAVSLIALVRVTLVRRAADESQLIDAILEVADARMTYRRRYMAQLRTEAVLDLVLFDESNPRSLASQLVALRDNVEHLPRKGGVAGRSAEERLALAAVTDVQLADAAALARVADGRRPALLELLDRLMVVLPEFSDALTQQYLSHLQTSRHLAPAPESQVPT